MSNLVRAYFQLFLLEDLPQTFLQLFYVISQTLKKSKSLPIQIYISTAVANFTTISSFYKFSSIRPTNLLQEDFDLLQIQKNQTRSIILQNEFTEEQNQIKIYTESLKKKSNDILQVDNQFYEEAQKLLS
ncbi:unnamed protein product [Paramecium sonneborni]|uniref:Uncharacterized protein n=1 Tax=Paramecium sonneborni TaxID=65129 RepID=A0A8S1Q0B4_9CILI|nr:unnamed protein product [Paramecium sonneborni]